VRIEAPSFNSRLITADILIDAPIPRIWSILTDYNNLATHIPNLVQSYVVPVPGDERRIRMYQEGAQRIIGFDFRASLLMDMQEEPCAEKDGLPCRRCKIGFTLVESRMFDAFDGAWTLTQHSSRREYDAQLQRRIEKPTTKLTYTVAVRPRGPVPVLALEWRIKEDVPINLRAIKVAAERLAYHENNTIRKVTAGGGKSGTGTQPGTTQQQLQQQQQLKWESDETLGLYAD
jgi:hypothetical protein